MKRDLRRGVTLIEMMIVVTLISLMVGITFPAVTSGIDSLRLLAATDSIVSFLNGAMSRADRRQEVMEITIFLKDNKMVLRGLDPSYVREISLPDGVTIERVLPEFPGAREDLPRQFMLMPGGSVPRISIEIRNRRGAGRIVGVDPVTGVPQVTRLDNSG